MRNGHKFLKLDLPRFPIQPTSHLTSSYQIKSVTRKKKVSSTVTIHDLSKTKLVTLSKFQNSRRQHLEKNHTLCSKITTQYFQNESKTAAINLGNSTAKLRICCALYTSWGFTGCPLCLWVVQRSKVSVAEKPLIFYRQNDVCGISGRSKSAPIRAQV